MEAIITVGCSGSGKSTFAGMTHHVEVNRDDIRFGIVSPQSNGDWKKYQFTPQNEGAVTQVQNDMILEIADRGEDIIISDTNLNGKIRRKMIQKLKDFGYDVTVMYFDVPEEQIRERDTLRGKRSVGVDVLERQVQQTVGLIARLQHESRELGYDLVIVNN